MDAINYILGPDYDKKVNEYASEMAKLYDNKTVIKPDAEKDMSKQFRMIHRTLNLAEKYHDKGLTGAYSFMINFATELIKAMSISEKIKE